ncbi:DDX58-like protein [Mya arenaria]|uniref:DDX58-like protein n=1 Tax=Mya arenaria TaxID=6604 RepID=A0ABY7FF61_MYAAR|nr:DDX58-like protein [Mya arenaria]
MSANIFPNVSLLEGRLQFWRREIVRCLDKPTFLSQLAAKDVFNEDEKSRLLEIYQNRTTTEAGEAVLDSFLESSAPNKWISFLNALEEAELKYVKSLLEEDIKEPEEDRVRGRKLIQLFGPELEKNPVKRDDAVLSDENQLESDAEKIDKYQTTERAIQGENTIICADTGTGKTTVAMHIASEHLSKATKGTRKVVVMASTAILISEQADKFKKKLPEYKTKLISGGEEESTMLHVFVKDADILCFTPQILVNNLENGNIPSLAVFSLLIFDECHHTKGSGAYGELARRYLREKLNKRIGLPQIVGLTASIGVGHSKNEEDAVEYITKVCAALDVKRLSTVERCRTNFEKYVNTPKEDIIKMTVRADDPCSKLLNENIIKTEDILNDICFEVCEPDIIDVLDKRPREKGTLAYYGWTIQIEKTAKRFVDDRNSLRDITTCATYLNVYCSAFEVNTLLQVRDVMKYLANETKVEADRRSKFTDREKELFENFKELQKELTKKSRDVNAANPNVEIIIDQLTKMFLEKGLDSRAMVFVKTRATCIALRELLDNRLEYKARCLYGQKQIGSMKGMSPEEQTEVLERFKEGRFKIIVCTSVAIEGIDVPDCNIVINYNFSGDEITKIQMRGRSRRQDASTLTVGNEKIVEKDKVSVRKCRHSLGEVQRRTL